MYFHNQTNTVVIIDYKSVLRELEEFLKINLLICDEDYELLVKYMLMSYFSKTDNNPSKILSDYLDRFMVFDINEIALSDVMLSVIENIDRLTKTHLPGLTGLGFMPDIEFEINDVSVLKKYQLLITLSESTLLKLKHMAGIPK